MQDQYGQLCNIAAYPACYVPYDMPARQTYWGEDDDRVRRIPSTFYQREFIGSIFPVYISEEEYDSRFFKPREYSIEGHSDPRGYYTYTNYPCVPSQRMLCTKDSEGKLMHVRNMPRRDREEEQNTQ